jgi:alkyl hydroperoxide reductase subunit AhpF
MTERRLLNQAVIDQIRDVFKDLSGDVRLLFFGRKANCDYCAEALQLADEVSRISDKLDLIAYDLDEDAELARLYGVDKAPALVLLARDGEQVIDYGVRFSGIPSGHEFASLIHDLVLVSGRDSGLKPQTRDFLKSLSEPIHLLVFSTPT